jgi:hypothetical protein
MLNGDMMNNCKKRLKNKRKRKKSPLQNSNSHLKEYKMILYFRNGIKRLGICIFLSSLATTLDL